MKLRATIQIRNDHMLSAREDKNLTQTDLAAFVGVSANFISQLERLQYPVKYRYENALLIAHELDIPVECVWPEELADWKGQTKFSYIAEAPTKLLLEYQHTITQHFLLPSPDEILEKQEELSFLKKLITELSYRKEEIIKLRYGLSDGYFYTYEEVGKIFRISKEHVRQIELSAIRDLQKIAAEKSLCSKIQKSNV